MKQYLIIGAVLAVIAVIIAAFAFGALGGSGDQKGQYTATIYLEELDTGNVYQAEVDLGNPTSGEMAMMSLFGGIRDASFKPMQSTPGEGGDLPTINTASIYKSANYAIWVAVNFKVTGVGMKSLDKVTIDFHGSAGGVSTQTTPDHLGSANELYASGPASTMPIIVYSDLKFDTNYVIKSNEGSWGSFDKVKTASGIVPLVGDTVDGALVTIQVGSVATSMNGESMTSNAVVTFKLNVPSYGATSMTTTIVGYDGGL